MDENGSKGHSEVTPTAATRHIDATTAELLHHIDATFNQMGRHIEAGFAEIRRHFDVAMEKTSHELDLLQERIVPLNQSLDRSAFEMRASFAETWALLQSFQRPEDYTE